MRTATAVATRGHLVVLGSEATTGSPPNQELTMVATISRKLVSITDAADALAVSTRTVRRYIADGQLEAVRLGRKTLRIKVDSIERFIDARPVGGRAGLK
jgi:excisionase family DNA binding protein